MIKRRLNTQLQRGKERESKKKKTFKEIYMYIVVPNLLLEEKKELCTASKKETKSEKKKAVRGEYIYRRTHT